MAEENASELAHYIAPERAGETATSQAELQETKANEGHKGAKAHGTVLPQRQLRNQPDGECHVNVAHEVLLLVVSFVRITRLV